MKKITLLSITLITAVSYPQIIRTSFEEPSVFGILYTDTGDPNSAHDLINNSGEPFVDFGPSGGELGYDARYVPYDSPGVGLTDGDLAGVTDEDPAPGIPYADGSQGYAFSDIDGNYILEFDAVDLGISGHDLIEVKYFIAESDYEGDGTSNTSGSDRFRIYVKDLTNNMEHDIFDSTGSDIDDLQIEGSWQYGGSALPFGAMVRLVVEARNNSADEAFFIDDILFTNILSTNEVGDNFFTLYPTPVSNGVLRIASRNSAEIQVSVYNVLGQMILADQLANGILDVSNLSSGMYVLKLRQGNFSESRKLIVK